MTAVLWLEKPCEEHGSVKRHCICNCIVPDPQHGEWCWCEGGSRVRLDPDKVVFPGFTIGSEYVDSTAPSLTVQDIIDALVALEEE